MPTRIWASTFSKSTRILLNTRTRLNVRFSHERRSVFLDAGDRHGCVQAVGDGGDSQRGTDRRHYCSEPGVPGLAMDSVGATDSACEGSTAGFLASARLVGAGRGVVCGEYRSTEGRVVRPEMVRYVPGARTRVVRLHPEGYEERQGSSGHLQLDRAARRGLSTRQRKSLRLPESPSAECRQPGQGVQRGMATGVGARRDAGGPPSSEGDTQPPAHLLAALAGCGVSDEDRRVLLGHSNASLSQHYALPDIGRLQEMSERVTIRRETVILRTSSATA